MQIVYVYSHMYMHTYIKVSTLEYCNLCVYIYVYLHFLNHACTQFPKIDLVQTSICVRVCLCVCVHP